MCGAILFCRPTNRVESSINCYESVYVVLFCLNWPALELLIFRRVMLQSHKDGLSVCAGFS